MEVSYSLLYHPLVVSEDISRINQNIRKRIAKAVHKRLSTHPELYGKPLRGTLAGYWKLRVGDYRIVYKVVKCDVWIFAVMNRRDIYTDIVKRLFWK